MIRESTNQSRDRKNILLETPSTIVGTIDTTTSISTDCANVCPVAGILPTLLASYHTKFSIVSGMLYSLMVSTLYYSKINSLKLHL